MRLKTKLTLSITLLVLLVVVAANLIFVAGAIPQEVGEVNSHANFLAREIFNQLNQELIAAHAAGQLGAGAEGLREFLDGRRGSVALTTLFNSAIGNNGSVLDVALVQPDGTIAMDSNPLLEGHKQSPRELLSVVAAQGPWRQLRTVTGPEEVYDVTLAATVNNVPLGNIRVGVDTVLLRQAMLARLRQLTVYGGLIVLLATCMAWALADLALVPLNAISAQLDRLGSPAVAGTGGDHGDEVVRVQSKIARLGQQMADTREVYTALQENVSQVMQSLEAGLLLFDAGNRCVMASAAAPRLLGWTGGDLISQPVESVFASDSSLDRAVRQVVRDKSELAPREWERQGGGGALLVRVDLVRDRDGQTGTQAGTLVTLRDAEPVSRLEQELEVARRLSAVGRLTRGVAHEVKNPLNAMAIHLNLLRTKAAGGAGNAALQPHVQVIGREIERLDRAVRTFLDFSRPVELKLVKGNLTDVARGVTELMREAAAAQGIAIVLRAPEPGPRIWLDRDLIEQALLNLVNNGMQAMAEGGGGRQLSLEVFTEGRQANLRVRDQGAGVPVEHRDKIFDLYFTTRSGGSGIGLALAARIMQLHQGGIELEAASVAEPGASFLLRFPLLTGAGPRSASPSDPLMPGRASPAETLATPGAPARPGSRLFPGADARTGGTPARPARHDGATGVGAQGVSESAPEEAAA